MTFEHFRRLVFGPDAPEAVYMPEADINELIRDVWDGAYPRPTVAPVWSRGQEFRVLGIPIGLAEVLP